MNRITLAALLALSCAPGFAQEVKSPWSGDAELGYVASEGNTEANSLTANGALIWERGRWKNDADFHSLSTKSSGVQSAEKYFLSNRLSCTFSPNNYTFGYFSHDDDRFSGYKYKSTIAVGYGRRLINREDMLWDTEVGPGYRRAEIAADAIGKDEEEGIVRVSSNFSWDLSPTATFEQKLSVESGDKNTVSKSSTSLKTSVAAGIALKVAYLVYYTENAPVGKVHADKQTTVTMVYSF
ncbi:MAG: putative salt-induced outer membrane protein [Bermanella sp.]|jgi:putative salt-induced outer membrane protein